MLRNRFSLKSRLHSELVLSDVAAVAATLRFSKMRGERAQRSKKFHFLTLNQSNAYTLICVFFFYSFITYKNNFNFLGTSVAKEKFKR